MPLVAPEALDAIRSRLSIDELAREYVPDLKRAGRNFKGRCPFHQEKTPSFIVSPERQSFHCFGCGEGGDLFTFLMKLENLSFTEAVEKLADRAGVKVQSASEALGPLEREKLKMKEALEFAEGFYHEQLKGASGAAGRKYLAERGVLPEAVEAFKLGFAAPRADLAAHAGKKGFPAALLVKAGLAAAREGGGFRDYFFNRVLYPIRDARGSVVGFGARTLGDAQPKYLNSPDSPVFSKGRLLYGLFQGLAEIRKARKALIMEGYMDVIATHQHGLKLACAPLGTALTPDQAALLKRYVTDVTVVFDSDNAGLMAAVRGAAILLEQGLGVRIAAVPGGKDPDEHLRQFGVESFKSCLEKAVDLAEFQTEVLLKKYPASLGPEQKAEVARQVLATIAHGQDEVLKSEWTRRLAGRLGVSEEALRRQQGKDAAAERPAPAKAPAPLRPAPAGPIGAEDEHILLILLKRPDLAARVQDEDLQSPTARGVASAVRALAGGAASQALDALTGAERALASRLLVDPREEAKPEEALQKVLDRVRKAARLKILRPKVRALGENIDAALLQEYHALETELRGNKSRA